MGLLVLQEVLRRLTLAVVRVGSTSLDVNSCEVGVYTEVLLHSVVYREAEGLAGDVLSVFCCSVLRIVTATVLCSLLFFLRYMFMQPPRQFAEIL